jgi:SulP family sulfate permease
VGFGAFAIATALIYRRPVPVQPMKIVAGIVIATGIGPAVVAASGLLLGLTLVALALTNALSTLARAIPQSVLTGVQLAVGLHLAWAGWGLVSHDLLVGGLVLGALIVTDRSRLKALALLATLAAAAAWGATRPDTVLPGLSPGLHLPALALPDWDGIRRAAESVLLPQMALTLTNAVLVTAAIAAHLFPDDRARITPRRLALSSGALNLVLAPLGAFPMCHGAGGLVAQHKFGARTGLAPAIFGLTCLAMGLMLGPQATQLLSVLPLAAVGALLVIAGVDLAVNKRLFDRRPDHLAVILLTAAVGVGVNVAAGLVAGAIAEAVRVYWRRRVE